MKSLYSFITFSSVLTLFCYMRVVKSISRDIETYLWFLEALRLRLFFMTWSLCWVSSRVATITPGLLSCPFLRSALTTFTSLTLHPSVSTPFTLLKMFSCCFQVHYVARYCTRRAYNTVHTIVCGIQLCLNIIGYRLYRQNRTVATRY